jgi:hypothetical protein
MHAAHTIALIAWNPEIRNILALLVGVGVLMGSVGLLVSTNTGPRTGMLVVLAGLFGWMLIMGVIWWMYGIGMKGTASHWRAIEINSGDLSQAANEHARALPELDETTTVEEILAAHPELEKKVNPDANPKKIISVSELVEADPAVKSEFHLEAGDRGGWRLLNPSDKQRGDAQAVADAALKEDKVFEDSSKYKLIEVYDIGGKRQLPADPSRLDRIWDNIYSGIVQITHPEHFALVQVQAVIPQETLPGQAPPTPVADPNAPTVSVILIRSLGDLRFPAFMVTLIFGILFAITCNTLHRRDKLIAANRAAAPA